MEFLIILRRVALRLRLGAAATARIVLLIMLAPGIAQAESVEYAVKAAYLYKFGIYVEWPAGAFSSPNAPLVLCVVGEDPFGPMLDTAVREQHIDRHPIEVRRLKTVGRDSGCHILYLGLGDAQRASQAEAALKGTPVLTVGDARIGGGGIITFVISDNRVRFDIDEEAAVRNGLTISSKLLSLALNVKPRSPNDGRQ